MIDKKSLSERDICTKFTTPALKKAGWDEIAQIREEVSFTKGRIRATAGATAARTLVSESYCGDELSSFHISHRAKKEN